MANAKLVEGLDGQDNLNKVLPGIIFLEGVVGGNAGKEVAAITEFHHQAKEVIGLKELLNLHEEVPGITLNSLWLRKRKRGRAEERLPKVREGNEKGQGYLQKGHLVGDLASDFLQVLNALLVDKLEGKLLPGDDVVGELDLGKAALANFPDDNVGANALVTAIADTILEKKRDEEYNE